jgi:hypothetical protein
MEGRDREEVASAGPLLQPLEWFQAFRVFSRLISKKKSVYQL